MIRIEIEVLPPRELSPNYSHFEHWGKKAKAKKEWQETIYYTCVDWAVRNKDKGLPYEQTKLKWTFIYRTKRKRDIDNLIASCKCGQDCLVKAGLIVADDSEHLALVTPEIIVDKERAPRTIIELKRVRWKVEGLNNKEDK